MSARARLLGTGAITIGGDLAGRPRSGPAPCRVDAVTMLGEYPDHDGGIALLRHVVDPGLTFIDTADVYGPHSNEQLIREALLPYPEDLDDRRRRVVSYAADTTDSTLGAVGNPNYLRQSVHMSLRANSAWSGIDLY